MLMKLEIATCTSIFFASKLNYWSGSAAYQEYKSIENILETNLKALAQYAAQISVKNCVKIVAHI